MGIRSLTRLAPLLALIVVGCTSGAAVKSHGAGPPNARRVLGEELVATRQADLLKALCICRPTFVRSRDAMRQPPALYLDGIAMADFDAIHDITASEVLAVEYMSGPDATTRYGTGHVGGALLVWTKRGQTNH